MLWEKNLMYGSSLFVNIKPINHACHWFFRRKSEEEESECLPSQGKLDHLGNTQVYISCHTASVHWDQMWSESLYCEEIVLWFGQVVTELSITYSVFKFRSITTVYRHHKLVSQSTRPGQNLICIGLDCIMGYLHSAWCQQISGLYLFGSLRLSVLTETVLRSLTHIYMFFFYVVKHRIKSEIVTEMLLIKTKCWPAITSQSLIVFTTVLSDKITSHTS